MLFFIFGKDTYRAHRKLEEIIERYKKIHKSGLNLKILDLKEKSFEDFKNEFQSVSMFAEKKLIILKNASFNKEFKKLFLKSIKDFASSKEIIFFVEEGEIPEDDFFKELKKVSKFQKFEFLEGYKLNLWIKKEFEKYKCKIEEKAIEKLAEFIGSDLWQMENEIKKLVAFKKKGEIKLKDVEELVSPKIEVQIFKTLDAIAEKNKAKSFRLLKKHLEKGEKISYLFSMIKLYFKNMLMIKDLMEKKEPISNFQQKTKLHPFVIEKCLALAKKFQLQDLKRIYQKIFEIDLAIKTNKVEPETALILFINQL